MHSCSWRLSAAVPVFPRGEAPTQECQPIIIWPKFVKNWMKIKKIGRGVHIQNFTPANEVWGKVMFLHVSVILFTGEGLTGRGGGLHPGRGGSAYRWRVCLQEEAVYNLRIPFNLTVRTSNLKSNLPGWKSTCQAWIWIIDYSKTSKIDNVWENIAVFLIFF